MKFKLLKDGHLMISDESRKLQWKNFKKDLILVCGEKELPASRKILAGSSQYFSAMLSGYFCEKWMSRIRIHGVDPDALEQLITFAQVGEITLTEDNIQALITAADMLGATDVLAVASDYLGHLLHPSNVIGILAFARHLNCVQLTKDAESFLAVYFQEVKQYEEYLKLTPDEVSSLRSIPKPSAMPQVVLNLTSERTQIGIFSFQEKNWKDLPAMPAIRSGAQLALFRGALFVLGGIMGRPTKLVQVYHFKGKKWSPWNPSSMKVPRAYFRADIKPEGNFGARIYVTGGVSAGHMVLDSAEWYDVVLGSWKKTRPMDTGRAFHGSVFLGNALYVVGGQGKSGSSLASVERYETRTWTVVASMHEGRAGVGVGAIGNNLYAVGGWNGTCLLSSVEMYIPEENVWKQVPSMIKPRRNAGVVVNNGRLIVIGGDPPEFNTVECYNPDTDKWNLLPSAIPYPMRTVCSITMDQDGAAESSLV